MGRPTLDEVLAEDDAFGLLDVKPIAVVASGSEADEVVRELEAFAERHARPPARTEGAELSEKILAAKAGRLAADPRIGALLNPVPAEAPGSIDDILDDDMLADDDVFVLRNVKAREVSEQPDYVGSRKPCEDFEEFRPVFDAAAADLQAGRREAIPFAREQEIEEGQFFIRKGVTAYVAEAGPAFKDRLGNTNRRLRVIFEDGTESDPLLRSFSSTLYNDDNGRRVTDPSAGPLFVRGDELAEGDVVLGIVYAARTLSEDPNLAKLAPGMLKIGVTTQDPHRRVSDAVNDPTFLLAPARIVVNVRLVGYAPRKVEKLLHRFFDPARVAIEMRDRFGKVVRPREWFFVTPDHVSEAVRRIQDGTIMQCYFDRDEGVVDLGA